MTNLMERRSVIALCCGALSLVLAFYGIIAGVIRTVVEMGADGFFSFAYFTMVSNVLAMLSVAFVIPFAVEGVRKKRFILPGWVAVTHYLATTSIAVMMVFVLAFMSWASPEDAFGGSNIVTHVFCPALILISFFQMENGHIYSMRDRLVGIIPVGIYLAVYVVEVELIGEANGGWPDLYRIQEYLPTALAIPAMLLFAFVISTMVALVSNHLTRRRNIKTFMYWNDDVEPFEVRIEAYGLGWMAGQCGERNSIWISLDTLEYLATRYQLEMEDLMKPFFKGVQAGIRERDSK